MSEAGANFRGANGVEGSTGRVRVPYAFASDNWADIGNVSVFRPTTARTRTSRSSSDQHPGNRHILDNYRRSRHDLQRARGRDRSFER